MTSAGNEQLEESAREASQNGEVAVPEKLVALIAALEQPLFALQEVDKSNELFAAFDEDFGFIRFSFANYALAPKAQLQLNGPRYAGLLRWLITELRQWRRAEDSRFEKLVATIVAAHTCDIGNALWPLLPDDIGENADLIGYLKELVASFDIAFSARGDGEPPIWESEAVEAFKRADAEGDWAAVIGFWQKFAVIFPNALQTETVRFLYRYDRNGLATSLSKLHKTPVAMQVAGVLSELQRLQFGIASENPYLQLACAYRTLVDFRGAVQRALPDEHEAQLAELLLKVARDPSRWSAWMKALRRYPALQKPLGRALVQVADAALCGFVDSVWLFPKQTNVDEGRRSATECLRVFCAEAAPQRRKVLWTLAHKRWLDWAFNTRDPNQHLTAVSWSDLDYAVVGYALECMDEPARRNAMLSICREMEGLEYLWHASHSDMLTAWYRLLSQFQPYAHASAVAPKGGDWLHEVYTYLPPALVQDRYLALVYGAAA